MADQPGIDLMRRRIERAARHAPPSRRPAVPGADAASEPAVTLPTGEDPRAEAPAGTAAVPPRPARPRAVRSTQAERAEPVRLEADLPPVNLAIRVRRPLDDRLADVIHQLRQDGVRTSKVELIEMLLWEMPADQAEALRERLRRFREWAPRGTSAPLGPGGAGGV